MKFFGDNRTGHKGIIPLNRVVEEQPKELVLRFVHSLILLNFIRVSLYLALSSSSTPCRPPFTPGSHFLQLFFSVPDPFAGMFIYPATMLRYLRQTYTYEDFSTVLASVPQDINSLYRASLMRLQKSHSRSLWLWIREIFSWVTLPPRDIGVKELREGISVSRRVRYEPTAPLFLCFMFGNCAVPPGEIIHAEDRSSQLSTAIYSPPFPRHSSQSCLSIV